MLVQNTQTAAMVWGKGGERSGVCVEHARRYAVLRLPHPWHGPYLQAGKGVVQRAKEGVSATVAAASEKAADVLQTAKEMAGFGGGPSKQ
jgi:hypothetical protein